jgi:beta-lactam-binding protein with PASTA domain/tRNA A-37 threonylcarbamoyl transferase component Bud32
VNAPPAALLDSRYRVGSMIARGGMSTVYRGTDTRLDRPVAIKIIDSRLAADPVFRTRVEREARSAARIDHPNVVDVYDQGDHQGPDGPTLFLVMELVEGGTLRDVLRLRGALGVPAAIAVMAPVLAGLAEAHRLGLVHRDIKPENVLISRTGEVKVADFGLVVAAAEAGASHVGMIMGTVAYLSPEQVTTGSADARSDVYGAGVMFYELLTGEPPYRGETAISVAYRHVNSDLPAPSDTAGDVPPELDELIQRATRRDPAARPADAAAFLAELRRVAEFLEVPRVAVPVPPAPPPDEQDTLPGHRAVTPMNGHAAGPRGTRALPRPVIEEAAAPLPAPPHVRVRRRSRRVFAVWTALVLALALAVAVGAWWLGSGRWTTMPPIVGLQEAAARQLLDQSDLGAVTVEKYDSADAGQVTAADQQPAAELLRGSTVNLTVSAGQPVVPVITPGTSVADAQKAIQGVGLVPRGGGTTEFSDTAPAGTVTRTDPPSGRTAAPGSTVQLVLSKGKQPQQVRVPRVVGESFDDAERELEALGLKAEERPAFGAFGQSGGRVVNQDQGAGSMVDPGKTIVLDTFPL